METEVRKALEPHIRAVSNAWRVLGGLGLIDTIFNHISVTAVGPNSDMYMMMNSFQHLAEELYPDQVRVFPLREYTPPEAAGLGVNPDGLRLHSLVHRARMRPGAVIHTHSVNCIAVGCTDKGLLPISQTAVEFAGEIDVVEYTGAFRGQQLTDKLQKLATNGGAIFLRNHGSLMVADDLAVGVYLAYYLEEACRIQVATLSQGVPFVTPDPSTIEETHRVAIEEREEASRLFFEAVCRRLLD